MRHLEDGERTGAETLSAQRTRLIIRRIRIRKDTRKEKRIDVHWSCSRLSALSLMRRTAMMLVALAALMASAARASSVSSTPHRKSPASGLHTYHTARRPVGARSAGRTSPSRNLESPTHASTAHRQSANEVGRRSGLAIRRQLAQRGTMRQRAVARPMETQTSRKYRTATDRIDPFSQVGHGPQPGSPSGRPAATDGSARTRRITAASVATNQERAQGPVRTQAATETAVRARIQSAGTPQNGEEIADNEPSLNSSAPAERMASPVETRSTESATAVTNETNITDDGVDESSTPAPSDEATSVRAESELALLRIPRAGTISPLRGSLESLERQNARLDAEGLERIEDEDDLASRIANKLLVPLPASAGLTVNGELLENHRYCRPWTARFLSDLSKAHEAMFHKPLEVSSAVRTVEYQRRLMRTNGNAAPAEGDIVSPHLTGATIDIAKQGLGRREMVWMRQRLLALQSAGKIDVEEEFRQACFHITVYKGYAPAALPHPLVEAKVGKPHRRPTAIANSLAASTPVP